MASSKMLNSLWRLSVNDPPQRAFFVFYSYDESPTTKRGVELRPEYRHLVCSQCGWYDPRKAAKIGIPRDVRCPFRNRDIVVSDDGRLVVSRRCRLAFSRIPGLECEYFPFPGDPSFFLAFASRQLLPPKNARICKNDDELWTLRQPFIIEGKCSSCKHFSSVSFQWQFLRLSSQFSAGAAILDRGGWDGRREAWIASERVAHALQKMRLTGFKLRKVEVDKDATSPIIRRLRK